MPLKSADVAEEYAKNKELRKEDVEVLNRWLKNQPHLPEVSELHLILFLHSCYFNIEAAKAAIEKFLIMKATCQQFLGNRDPNSADLQKSMGVGVFAKLPKETPEGYKLLFFGLAECRITKYVFVDQLKLFDMNIRLWLEEDGTSNGFVVIINMDQFNHGHLAKMNVSEVKDFITYVQEALPVRVKRIHFVNAGKVMENVMALIKPLLKKEILKILHVHKDVWDDFYKYIPQEYLPVDYGGKGGHLNVIHGNTKQKLVECADFFMEDDKQVADESKRFKLCTMKSLVLTSVLENYNN